MDAPRTAPCISGLEVAAVNVPMRTPHRTASGVLTHAPLVLLDLQAEDGTTGRAYVFTYTPIALKAAALLLREMAPLLQGQPLHPQALERLLEARFRLLGPQGLVMIAMAAVDMAAWDALARSAQLPLARLLGAEPRALPAYASLGMEPVEEAVRQATAMVERGFRALKFKIGHADWREDQAFVRAVREAVGPDVELMVDYNQSLSLPEAVRRCRALDGEGLAWIEEPLLQTDWAGHAELRRQLATPVQLGENWWGTADMARSIAAGASDLAMPDVMKLGGVSAWLRGAALAQAAGLPVSSHIFTEFSAHLMCATPTAHRIEILEVAEAILQQPYAVIDGRVPIPDRPGVGLEWDAAAVERYRVA
jgi:mandelate racemase